MSITYELAKQLNESGFKSDHQMDMDTGSWCVNCPFERGISGKGFANMCYPTLSELIEACGYEFLQLNKYQNTNIKKGLWQAGSVSKEGYQWGHRGLGSTPEEAVVRLWLELNK